MVISNAGLDQILTISVPILNILYPPAIVLILLSFLPRSIQRFSAIYPVGIAFTSVASILYAAQGMGLSIPALDRLLKAVPLSGMGLGWSFRPWPECCWASWSLWHCHLRGRIDPCFFRQRGVS